MLFNDVDIQLRKKFVEERGALSITPLRYGMLFGAALYLLFSVLDLYALPVSSSVAFVVRFGVVFPVLIAVYTLTYFPVYLKYYKAIGSVLIFVLGYGINAMIFFAQPGEYGFLHYYSGIILVVVGTHLLFQVGFYVVTANTLLIVLGYEFIAVFVQELPENNMTSFISNNFFLLSSNVLGIVATYFQEKYRFAAFLSRHEKEIEKEQVAAKSEEIRLQHAMILEQHTQLLKQDKVSNQFEQLVNQLQPHFFFNCLSSLSYLVETDTRRASRFIDSFSDTYRYILQMNDEIVVDVHEEIAFVKAYSYMQNFKLDDCLFLTVDLPEDEKFSVPPFSIQLLVENAIKHNDATPDQPLRIYIDIVDENYLSVKHKLNRYAIPPVSTKIGLKNLEKRYNLIGDLPVIMLDDGESFEVKIPLIFK